MKTIAEIKETWDAAPDHGDGNKNILVAEALGWTGIKWLPSHPNYLCTKPDGNNEYLPDFTTDPKAVLQAMDDVGIVKRDISNWRARTDSREHVVTIWDWLENAEGNTQSPWYKAFCDIQQVGSPTLELACAFAVYAFSELKEGAE